MNETSDELDRLAEEFDKSRQDQQDRCAKAMEAGAVHAEITARARAGAFEEVVNRLRERAEELRRPLSEKPTEVRLRQWWRFGGGKSRLVTTVSEADDNAYVCFDWNPSPSHPRDNVSDMLSSPDWTYLGDGTEPAR